MGGHFVDISFMEGASRQVTFRIIHRPILLNNSLCVVLTLLPSLSCTQGDDCQLEHVQGYNNLIKELCKFYVQGFCSKGDSCPYMHNILWSKNNNLPIIYYTHSGCPFSVGIVSTVYLSPSTIVSL